MSVKRSWSSSPGRRSGLSPPCVTKKHRLRGRRLKKEQGEKYALAALRQHVAQSDVAHGEVRVLRGAGRNKPGSPSEVRRLRYQEHRAVLRVLPECLCPFERAFLDGPVVGVG